MLDRKITKIVYSETQKSKRKFFASKSVRFDAYLADVDKIINVEMQASHYSDALLRARYYQSMIDATLLQKGEPYKNLKDTCLLFVCRDDPFNLRLPIECGQEENIMNYNDFNMLEMDAKQAGREQGRQEGYAMAVAEKDAEISRMTADIEALRTQIAILQAKR